VAGSRRGAVGHGRITPRRPFCGRGGISPAGSGLAAPAPWPPVPCLVPRARAAHLAPRSPSEETAAADGDPAVNLTTTARRQGKASGLAWIWISPCWKSQVPCHAGGYFREKKTISQCCTAAVGVKGLMNVMVNKNDAGG